MLYFKMSEAWFNMIKSYLEVYKICVGHDESKPYNLYIDGDKNK